MTEEVDNEIIATLNAIRSKDPRVYDKDAKFYTTPANGHNDAVVKTKRAKPVHLQDYHRQNLLSGAEFENDEDEAPLTYNQEQEQLKNSIVQQMHEAAEDNNEASDSDTGLLVAKKKPEKQSRQEPLLDVDNADKDPETFLSNFMSSRAWAYPDERNLQPFESDDDEDDKRAEEFEQAYNFRFEDPAKSNEKLKSHARDMAAKYSVRREEENPRQKRREIEKARREVVKQELREDKSRLRKLRVEEVAEKVRRIKRAAGLSTDDLKPEDWSRFVEEDWDDAQWEEEMQKRFDEEYYAEEDVESDADDDLEKKRKPKKPKFDDDIDIQDIVPDFEQEKPQFSLSDEEARAEVPKKRKVKKDGLKKEAKKERRIIEQLVDDEMQLDINNALPSAASKPSAFRYRETSPKSFGLTSRDILMADDSQLNQYAGLKKLSAFRDPERKRKDQKHLGKKARLRKWRQDVFGNEHGLQQSDLVPSKVDKPEDEDVEEGGVNIVTSGKKKRRRPKKREGEAELEM